MKPKKQHGKREKEREREREGKKERRNKVLKIGNEVT